MNVLVVDQPFHVESVGDSEDADLVPLQSGEDWVAQLDDDLSQTGENFRILPFSFRILLASHS